MESGHGVGLHKNGAIDIFPEKHFLHWLEALSLIGSLPDGVFAMIKLIDLLTVNYC